MTAEDAIAHSQLRLVDKNSGFVYHPGFNPPHSDDLELIDSPPPPDLSTIYPKVIPQLIAIEGSARKLCPVTLIPTCPSIGKLQELVEEFLKTVYTTRGYEPPFSTFVLYPTREEFFYVRLCADLYRTWQSHCIPIFGRTLTSVFSRLSTAKRLIRQVFDATKKAVQLVFSRDDARRSRAEQFLKTGGENSSELFHFIWHASMEVRAMNLEEASDLVQACLLNDLIFIPSDTDSIFTALMNRYHQVIWLIGNFKETVEARASYERVVVTPPDTPQQDQMFATLSESVGHSGSSRIALVRPSISPFGPPKTSASFEFRAPSRSSRWGDLPPLRVPAPAMSASHAACSRLGQIEQFLRSLLQQNGSPVLRDEAALLLRIFQYLTSLRSQITNASEVALHELRAYARDLAHKKCTREMESFSRNFRKIRNFGKHDGGLFQLETSLLDQDILELCESLEGKVPRRQDKPVIPTEQLMSMARTMRETEKEFVSIKDLLDAAEAAGVAEKEKLLLKSHILMNLFPEWIDLRSFFRVLSLGRAEVLDAIDEQPSQEELEVATPPEEAVTPITEEEEDRKPSKGPKRRPNKRS
jgi:hypothetical protein